MNWKVAEGSGGGVIEGAVSEFAWCDRAKPREYLHVSVSAKIPVGYSTSVQERVLSSGPCVWSRVSDSVVKLTRHARTHTHTPNRNSSEGLICKI
jgi:hypothetical protein